mgnify:CR=1 FL=1
MKDGLFEVGDEVFQIGFTPANTKRMIVEQVYARGNKPHYVLSYADVPWFPLTVQHDMLKLWT